MSAFPAGPWVNADVATGSDPAIDAAYLNSLEAYILGLGTGGSTANAFCIVVASHDSQPGIQAGANFTCTGTNDQTLINSAIAFASALSSAGGGANSSFQAAGKVQLTGGRFFISGTGVKMRTGVWLSGCGFLSELRATSVTSAGMIGLNAVNDHLCQISNLYLYGNSSSGGACDAINFDMTGSGTLSTSGYPDTNQDSQHLIHDLTIDQFTGSGRSGIKLFAGSGDNNRGNIVDRIQIRDCDANGIWFSAATDSFISNCHVGLGSASAGTSVGFRIEAGNTKLSNNKAFYCNGWGFSFTSGRHTVGTCEVQDCINGYNLAGSNMTVTGLTCDTCQTDGIVFAAAGISCLGFKVFVRGGGRFTAQTNGVRFAAGISNSTVIGSVEPANITSPVVGTGVAPAFIRITNGTTTVSLGA